MAGYIIGLGDRHFQNILIDKRSAEVLHVTISMMHALCLYCQIWTCVWGPVSDRPGDGRWCTSTWA
jgi:phosphatidylinositol kinase/protein kinase (PI-3  family)